MTMTREVIVKMHPAHFTAREMDILDQLIQGKTNREIAEALHLSTKTVKVHMGRINIKGGWTNRTQAAIAWVTAQE